MLDKKSILLVGNGGSLKGSKLGSKIDEFDEVIRINEGKTIGWEGDAGTRFTIWSTFNPEKKFLKYFRGYEERGYSKEQIKDIVKDIHEIWYVHPNQMVNYRFPLLNKYLQDGFKVKYGTQELINHVKRITNHSTTGFILINLLSLLYDRFYIVGFDFMGKTGDMGHHYFTDVPLTFDNPHDFNKEYEETLQMWHDGKVYFFDKDTVIEKSNYKGNEERYLI